MRKLLLSVLACVAAVRAAQPPAFRTYTYKVADGVEIQADVYGADDSRGRPGVIWIHGGALIVGHRGGVTRQFRDLLLAERYLIVSIDYRLAPEAKLPAIIEDLKDAWKWVRAKGPGLFGIDPNRIAVSGGSAGGYLTLMSGFAAKPCPRALVSFWGYGDITGEWYSRPDPFYSRQPKVPKEEAYAAVGGKVISGATGKNDRGRFYLYCRQNGLWPKEVGGRDPGREPEWFIPYSPVRNVTRQYPPTLLVHGTEDTDVPYQRSVLMDKELTRAGVPHELYTVPGGAHGLAGADPATLRQTYEKALSFLRQHLR